MAVKTLFGKNCSDIQTMTNVIVARVACSYRRYKDPYMVLAEIANSKKYRRYSNFADILYVEDSTGRGCLAVVPKTGKDTYTYIIDSDGTVYIIQIGEFRRSLLNGGVCVSSTSNKQIFS